MGREPEQLPGLNREAVVEAAMAMLDEVGVEGLSMRGLADRLGVKAASLYWHLRDKEQLLEILGEAVLERVEVPISASGWRSQVSSACAALAQVVQQRPAMAQVVLGSLHAVPRSRLARDVGRVLAAAGLADAEAAAFALVVEVVAAASVAPLARPEPGAGAVMTLGIDSGSWRVVVRAAAAGSHDIATSVGGGGAPHLDVRQDGLVLVRNRRGGNRGAVELSPEHTWYIKVHGGTWNTMLDLTGLRVSGIELDSGAGNVACTLPSPHGIVPIRVNSGIVGVTLRRPAGTAAHVAVSAGSVKVRLDGQLIRPAASDIHWDSAGAARSADRYDVAVYSGCVKVTLDTSAPAPPRQQRPAAPAEVDAGPSWRSGDSVGLILDGIEARLAGREERV